MVSYANGYNPLRWDCEKQGCFNVKRRPKIEVFADCFPRRINFGDVDGLVEINSKGLLLEWKSVKGEIPQGQKIAHKNLTADGKFTTIVVIGNAETMECSHYGLFYRGEFFPYKEADLAKVKEVIKRWAEKADKKWDEA